MMIEQVRALVDEGGKVKYRCSTSSGSRHSEVH
jgi:hypothetical protein